MLQRYMRVEDVMLGTAVRVNDHVKQWFQHSIKEVGFLFIGSAKEQVAHELLVALSPLAALGHTHPAFLLQEMQESDASKHLLDVVAHQFVGLLYLLLLCEVAIYKSLESRIYGWVWVVQHLFLVLVAFLYVFLACDIAYELLVLVFILAEELFGKRLHVESLFNVGNFNVVAFICQFQKILGSCAARLPGTEKKCVSLTLGVLFVGSSFVAIGKNASPSDFRPHNGKS